MWQSSGAGAQPWKDDGRLPRRAHALGAALGASRPHHAGVPTASPQFYLGYISIRRNKCVVTHLT